MKFLKKLDLKNILFVKYTKKTEKYFKYYWTGEMEDKTANQLEHKLDVDTIHIRRGIYLSPIGFV